MGLVLEGYLQPGSSVSPVAVDSCRGEHQQSGNLANREVRQNTLALTSPMLRGIKVVLLSPHFGG